MTFLLMLLAILPGLLICFFIFKMDKYEQEALFPLILSFLLGAALTFPVFFLQVAWAKSGWEDNSNIGLVIVTSFLVVGLGEELLKFLGLMLFPYRRPFFNEPLDGIVYAVVIAMGFATLENMLYAYRFGFPTVLIRAFTAVPAHGIFAVIMGYYVGQARFHPEKRIRLLITGLGIAILAHGFYDFFIIQDIAEWLMLIATFAVYGSIYFILRFIKKHQKNSPFRKDLNTSESIADVGR